MPMTTHRNQGKNTHRELALIESLKSPWKYLEQQSCVTAKNPAGKLCRLEGIYTSPLLGICSSLIHGEC